MRDLPSELLEDILIRLPVKSIKRLQCVAKYWCFLINSEYFVKLHLQWSFCTHSNHHLLLRGIDDVFSMDLDDPNNVQLINPPFHCESVHRFSNSCNGLVLVESDPPILWNPFTREYKILSVISDEYPYPSPTSYPMALYGFAYDSINDDYKVVRVVEQRNTMRHIWETLRTEIYSLKSDSWRQIENFTYYLPLSQGTWCVHVNGTLHTVVKCEPDLAKIMAFSVETETHYELELPCCRDAVTLGVLGGCLSVISSNESQVDIWVMMYYGVMESWTNLFIIAQPDINPIVSAKPLVCSKDGDRVLLNCNEHRLLWCDLRKGIMENVRLHEGLPFMLHAEACVASLVSLSQEKQGTSLYSL